MVLSLFGKQLAENLGLGNQHHVVRDARHEGLIESRFKRSSISCAETSVGVGDEAKS